MLLSYHILSSYQGQLSEDPRLAEENSPSFRYDGDNQVGNSVNESTRNEEYTDPDKSVYQIRDVPMATKKEPGDNNTVQLKGGTCNPSTERCDVVIESASDKPLISNFSIPTGKIYDSI